MVKSKKKLKEEQLVAFVYLRKRSNQNGKIPPTVLAQNYFVDLLGPSTTLMFIGKI
jgi:hypothetical protein